CVCVCVCGAVCCGGKPCITVFVGKTPCIGGQKGGERMFWSNRAVLPIMKYTTFVIGTSL
uniref:Uncharacterized protein n=1 Tax=Anopheles quadriannulatus TaxID=34691 RepID=A0A182XRN3_ANOQN